MKLHQGEYSRWQVQEPSVRHVAASRIIAALRKVIGERIVIRVKMLNEVYDPKATVSYNE